MDLEYIESLAELLRGSSIAEVTVRRGERSVTVRRRPGGTVVALATPAHPAVEPAEPAADTAALVPVAATALVPVSANGHESAEPRFELVKASRVGIFHRGGRPGGEPLVGVGDWAAAAQQLGSIESMTVCNEVDAPLSGRVVGIFVGDGEPVEYGQSLFHLQLEPFGAAAAAGDEP